ncbi:MAG TPA: Piwi domain-containing protein [Candidatus Hydrogenedens sp.]|nr:Piwi domain-containing protein [Candidatus Hydrogenedens sp.]
MKIENYKILLNFISLTKQDFEFIIYRKENKGEKKEDIGSNTYSNTLPIKIDILEERTKYWISFIQRDDFEKFVCKPEYNIKVTEHYLYYCLKTQVQKKLSSDEYIIPNNKFRKEIFLILNKHPEGKECLLLSPYYLKSEKRFGFLIDFKFIKESNYEFNRKIQQLSLSLDKDFKSNSNFYIDKYNKIEEFKTKLYSKIFPLQFEDNNFELEGKLISVTAATLKTKTYIVGNSNESNSQFMGIKNYGPYKSLEKPITLLFFFRNEHKLLASDLAKALRGEMFNTFDGIVSFFKIPSIKIKGIEVKDNDFTKSIKIEIENKTNENLIPIIILSKNENELYYKIKYEILKNHKMAVQFVSLELLKNKESLKWSVSNIGLQIFSKLGGIPWLVKPEKNRTLIIGIGQSHELSQTNNNQFKITKYFAYSVLTDSSGLFKEIKSVGKYSEQQSYLKKLSEFISEIINNHINDYDNFVIHCPFKIKKYELDKIKETLSKLHSNNKRFVLLKINDNNIYFGFNLFVNSLVPYESTFLQLSENEFLIWFEGLQYHNPLINKRISGPTHIEFYYTNKKLTLEDQKLFLQEVLNLSGANWRGFNSKSTPISIHYTRLVSKFIKCFSKYEEIDIENINPWFL